MGSRYSFCNPYSDLSSDLFNVPSNDSSDVNEQLLNNIKTKLYDGQVLMELNKECTLELARYINSLETLDMTADFERSNPFINEFGQDLKNNMFNGIAFIDQYGEKYICSNVHKPYSSHKTKYTEDIKFKFEKNPDDLNLNCSQRVKVYQIFDYSMNYTEDALNYIKCLKRVYDFEKVVRDDLSKFLKAMSNGNMIELMQLLQSNKCYHKMAVPLLRITTAVVALKYYADTEKAFGVKEFKELFGKKFDEYVEWLNDGRFSFDKLKLEDPAKVLEGVMDYSKLIDKFHKSDMGLTQKEGNLYRSVKTTKIDDLVHSGDFDVKDMLQTLGDGDDNGYRDYSEESD